jgi:hypothetical protein
MSAIDLIVGLIVLTAVLFLGAYRLARRGPPPPPRRWDRNAGAANDGMPGWWLDGGMPHHGGHGSGGHGDGGHGMGDGGSGGDGGSH